MVPSGAPLHPVPIPAPADAVFPELAPYSSIDPDTNSIRVQSWNATIEQQVGSNWQVAASYLGSYIDRIWGRGQINQGVYLGLGPCTLQGVVYPVCSTRAGKRGVRSRWRIRHRAGAARGAHLHRCGRAILSRVETLRSAAIRQRQSQCELHSVTLRNR